MKIIVLLAASMLGFGFAVQETHKVPAEAKIVYVEESTALPEEPVLDVVLDTVEISIVAPAAVAVK